MPRGDRIAHVLPEGCLCLSDPLDEFLVGAGHSLPQVIAGKVCAPAAPACMGDVTEDGGGRSTSTSHSADSRGVRRGENWTVRSERRRWPKAASNPPRLRPLFHELVLDQVTDVDPAGHVGPGAKGDGPVSPTARAVSSREPCRLGTGAA